MSNLFGPPPPPRPQILEPRDTDPEPEWYYPEPEPDPGRRRLAVVTAFTGVALLVFANLGTWLHFDGVHTNQQAVVATATIDDIRLAVAAPLQSLLVRELTPAAERTAGSAPDANDPDPKLVSDVSAAVGGALITPEFVSNWSDAVGVALEQQELAFEGQPLPDGLGRVVIEVQPFLKSAIATLTKEGYTVPVDLTANAYAVELNLTSGSVTTFLGTVGGLWWLMWLGAIALIAGSVAIATRRLRMGVIVCLDAVIMLGGCLLLVPLFRQVADDQAVNSDYELLVQHAYDALTKSFVHQTVVLIVVAAASALVLSVLSRSARRRQQRARAAA